MSDERMRLKKQFEMRLEYLVRTGREDFMPYCQLANMNLGWRKMSYLQYLLPRVQDFVENKGEYEGVQIFIVSIPPQHGKSMSITETLPGWYAGKYPGSKQIIVSYGSDLARKFGRRNKLKIKEWGGYVFGCTVSRTKKSDIDFEVIGEEGQTGEIRAVGILSGITGKSADLIIVDDPIKNREEADSQTQRDKIWGEFQNSVMTRLSANGKVIVIQTRWHDDDLTGRIVKSGSYDYAYVNIPCEAEENDILGRKKGDALAPEIGKDKKWLEKTKRNYVEGKNEDSNEFGSGKRAWFSLYQGNPVIEEGNIIDGTWWKYYDILPDRYDEMIMSIDAAFKGEDSSDFVVIQVWAKYGTSMFLIDLDRKRRDFPDTLDAIRKMKTKHPQARQMLIEDKANGPAIIQVLRKEFFGILPINPKGDKVARVKAVSYAIEAGNVYIPRNKPWVYEFLQETKKFPRGEHDDQVDAMSQALNYLMHTRNVYHTEVVTQDGYYSPGELEDIENRKKEINGMHSVKRPGTKIPKALQRDRRAIALLKGKGRAI